MSVIKEVVNTHDQLLLSGGGVAIVQSYGGTRTKYPNGWGIYRINRTGQKLVTDAKAHWQDFGKKIFYFIDYTGTTHERKRLALEAAKKWVAEQGWYDGVWARNRMFDYVPQLVNRNFPIKEWKR
jgi:hypothetical protein